MLACLVSPARVNAQDSQKQGDINSLVTDQTGVSKQASNFLLLATANINTLDVTKPTAGFGVQRATGRTLLRVMLQKNISEGTVSGNLQSAALGRPVLDPSLSDLGVAVDFRLRGNRWLVGTPPSDKKLGDFCKTNPGECSTYANSGYLSFKSAYATFEGTESQPVEDGEMPSAEVLSALVVPVQISFGYSFITQGSLPISFFGSKGFMFEPFVGLSSRFIGGDIDRSEREEMWNNKSVAYLGAEAGFELWLGGFVVQTTLSYLQPSANKTHVDGLSGLQFAAKFAFQLPWDVVQSDS